VLGGLLEKDTILRPREDFTDTHGFTEQLFGSVTCWTIALWRGCGISLANNCIASIDDVGHRTINPFQGTLCDNRYDQAQVFGTPVHGWV
jgi:hypothetical protein